MLERAHIDSQFAFGDKVARNALPSPAETVIVRPTVVVMSRRRIARPSARAPTTEPPSESSTKVAPRRSLSLANCSKSRADSSVTTPAAETQTRQLLPHTVGGPSLRHSKRIDGGLSFFVVGRSSANADTSPQASARAPTKYRINAVPFSRPTCCSVANVAATYVALRSNRQATGGVLFGDVILVQCIVKGSTHRVSYLAPTGTFLWIGTGNEGISG